MNPALPPLENRVGCIGAAMEVIGQKWTALLLRDLCSGPKRFRDFTESVPELTMQGIIETCHEGGYQLTEKGEALIPVLRAMADWGDKWVLEKKTA